MDRVGLIVAVAVLLSGCAAGLWRRRVDGRLRDVGVPRREVVGREVAGHEVAGHEVAGHEAVGREVAGREVAGREAGHDAARQDGTTVVADRMEEPGVIEDVEPAQVAAGDALAPEMLESLGVRPAQATLLQFSSAFCTPCRSVRRVSSEVAELLPGVEHVEVDAESHLDVVRELNIWRTPTLLVLDAAGRVVKRATGVPSKPQLIAVLGEILLPSR
jgi:thiol-disulfide isomerase/thioredoxin